MDRKHDVDNLLQTGIDLMAANGYHNTSINEVIRKAGLPKGSFYYLYKDKKAFALDAIKNYAEGLGKNMDRAFSNDSLSSVEAIKQYYMDSIQILNNVGYAQGCFLGNMGQEMSDVDDEFRSVIEQGFALIHAKLNAQLIKAQQAGELAASADTGIIADLIINTWHGSLIRMKTTRSQKPLDIFVNEFFSFLGCNV